MKFFCVALIVFVPLCAQSGLQVAGKAEAQARAGDTKGALATLDALPNDPDVVDAV